MFWSQFWPQLLATVVGVVLGIWGALWVERQRDRQARVREVADLRQGARDSVDHNLELCRQLGDLITQGKTPSFPMDTGLLDAVFPRLAQLSHEPEVLKELNAFRYQLHHLNRKLDEWLAGEREHWNTDHIGIAYEMRSSIRSSVSDHVAMLERSGARLLRFLSGASTGLPPSRDVIS